MSPMVAVTSSSEAFVMKNADMLETDPVAREHWNAFTDRDQGKRGPSLHDASVLENFIQQLHAAFPRTARAQAATQALFPCPAATPETPDRPTAGGASASPNINNDLLPDNV